MNLKVTDLFASCGGMSEGFRMAGFDVKIANEILEPAARTYRRNHPKTDLIFGDITDPDIKKQVIEMSIKNEVEVIIGGPPCQAYSVAGLRDPDDPRGKLFEDYLEVVEKVKPKVFVMENVKGLLSIMTEREDLTGTEMREIKKLNDLKDKKIQLILKRRKSRTSLTIKFTKKDQKELEKITEGARFQQKKVLPFQEKLIDKIKRRFQEKGYKVEYEVLNAADYGVPQFRERVIIIGTRCAIPIEFPGETHDKTNWVTVKEAIDDLRNLKQDESINHLVMNHSKEFLQKIKATRHGKSIFGIYSHAFNKPRPDRPSNTVKDNHGSVFLHYQKNRAMTPRELARLQSFPDEFIFEGSKSQVLKQIGNAVPPLLARAIGKSVKNMLKRIKEIESQKPKDQANIYMALKFIMIKLIWIISKTKRSSKHLYSLYS